VGGGQPATVRTEDGVTVHAGAVVVATNAPIHHQLAIHAKQAPYITYVIAAPLRGAAGSGDALYWDTADPYHYVRLQESAEGPVLIVGGEDHHAGEEQGSEEARWGRLEAWTRARVPIGAVTHRWSGQVMEPADGMAFIGRDDLAGDNVYLVTGDSGQGITHGTVAGILIAELVQGREHAWADLYDPGRKTLRSIKELAKLGLQVAGHYAEWVFGPPEEVDTTAEVAPGSGAVIRRRGRPVALYRDEAGVLHERSAVCRHLGCIVHWNDGAKTWDCPCHGSRYAPTGEALHGPARSGLEPVAE
jgi:nitrite reductase/ring-hydroxylating ferredoxin subunit